MRRAERGGSLPEGGQLQDAGTTCGQLQGYGHAGGEAKAERSCGPHCATKKRQAPPGWYDSRHSAAAKKLPAFSGGELSTQPYSFVIRTLSRCGMLRTMCGTCFRRIETVVFNAAGARRRPAHTHSRAIRSAKPAAHSGNRRAATRRARNHADRRQRSIRERAAFCNGDRRFPTANSRPDKRHRSGGRDRPPPSSNMVSPIRFDPEAAGFVFMGARFSYRAVKRFKRNGRLFGLSVGHGRHTTFNRWCSSRTRHCCRHRSERHSRPPRRRPAR